MMELWARFGFKVTSGRIMALASMITAIATGITAYVAFSIQNATNKITLEAVTIEQINDSGRKIDAAITEKIGLDMWACFDEDKRDSFGGCH